MAPTAFERYKPILHVTLAGLLLLFGIFKVVYTAFNYPLGEIIDWDMVFQLVAGLFYTGGGFWVLMHRPSFPWIWVFMFAAFIIEMGQIGNYHAY